MRAVLPALVTAFLAASPLAAQTLERPDLGGTTHSMGQPSPWSGRAGGSFGAHRRSATDSLSLFARAGVHRTIGNPLLPGLLGAQVEGYAGARTARLDGGVRAQLTIPVLGLGAGWDWNARDGQGDAVYSLGLPFGRGGVVGRGSRVQIDWLPGRGQTFYLGLTVPTGGHQGVTRPRRAAVAVPRYRGGALPAGALPVEATAALARARESALAIARQVAPMLDGDARDPAAAVAPVVREVRARWAVGAPGGGRTLEQDVRALHAETVRAFALALGDSVRGARAAAAARGLILEHVLLPYDRLLGQRRDPDTTWPYAAVAESEFQRWYLADPRNAADRQLASQRVMRELLATVEAVRARTRADWGDERFVWLPLQLALLPEEHDTQAELDALVERALRRPIEGGNRLWWVVNEQFATELGRQLHRARDYHVLWIHDYAGLYKGKPDSVSFLITTGGYLGAMLRRVREYDRTGTLPTFHVLIDQHFYEAAGGRLWLSLLERPLDHRLALPRGHEGMARVVAAMQDSLRQAVAASQLLQARRRTYGDAWLRNQVKVHVNVTNPSDFSYWSDDVLPIVGIPDNSLRDHRKIAFYDVSEDDPYAGGVLLTGMGIGQHYVGPNWEDRALLLEGPATLAVRDAATTLLREQGFRPEQIPWAMRPRPRGADYARRLAAARAAMDSARRADARVLTLQNETGLLAKDGTVLKAVLYSLMPAGSVLKLPDSIWQAPFLGSLAAGAALRGCRVLVIAPSLASAPSAGWPQMAGAWTILSRLVTLQRELAPELARVGGMVRVGFYDTKLGVGDLAGRARERAERVAQTPWLREVLPFHPAVLDAWRAREGEAPAQYLVRGREGQQPMLHLKGHLLATREGWDALIARPEWAGFERAYAAARLRQVARPDGATDVKELPDRVGAAADSLFRAFFAGAAPAELDRMAYYLAVGSANQDNRSLVENGEVTVLVAGWAGLSALIDFVHLAAGARWVDDVETLGTLLPPPSGFQYRVARWIRIAL